MPLAPCIASPLQDPNQSEVHSQFVAFSHLSHLFTPAQELQQCNDSNPLFCQTRDEAAAEVAALKQQLQAAAESRDSDSAARDRCVSEIPLLLLTQDLTSAGGLWPYERCCRKTPLTPCFANSAACAAQPCGEAVVAAAASEPTPQDRC